MTEEGRDIADALLALLVEELAERLAPRLTQASAAQPGSATPWLTTTEAIDYTRLPVGTFRKLAASGKIPSHGGRSKLFYRPELDEALLTLRGIAEEDRPLKRAS
jgi:excisionase family DNA binding protein